MSCLSTWSWHLFTQKQEIYKRETAGWMGWGRTSADLFSCYNWGVTRCWLYLIDVCLMFTKRSLTSQLSATAWRRNETCKLQQTWNSRVKFYNEYYILPPCSQLAPIKHLVLRAHIKPISALKRVQPFFTLDSIITSEDLHFISCRS